MHAELSVALNFIISHLYNKLPRRRVDVFREELFHGFELRFAGHWYPDEPTKGSGFRCVKLAADKVDPVVDAAAKASGLDVGEIKSYLPAGLTIWIDPHEVSCRLTENSPVQVIYRGGMAPDLARGGFRRGTDGGDEDGELQRPSCGFDAFGAAGARLQDVNAPSGWSSSGGASGGATSPTTGGATSRGILHPTSSSTTCFTAATFAQTKFGSTKMKTQGPQRPSRLSPTEPLSNGFPARLSPSSAPLNACWGLSPPGSVSPMQQSPSTQFGVMPTAAAGAGGARLAGLQEWMLLQHYHQQHQQLQHLAALRQQQQQRGMAAGVAGGHLALAPSLINARQTSPNHRETVRQSIQLQLPQLQQPVPPQPTHDLVTSHDVGLFPAPTRESGITSGLNHAVKHDGVRASLVDCVDWGLDAAVAGYAAGGLQQLLLAN